MNEAYRMDSPSAGDAAARLVPPEFAQSLPILPVQGVVVFPGSTVGLLIDDERRSAILQNAFDESREVLVVPLADSETLAERISCVVTRARVIRLKPQGKSTLVLVEGLARVVLERVQGASYAERGDIIPFVQSTPPMNDEYWQAGVLNLRDAAIDLVKHSAGVPEEVQAVLGAMKEPVALTDFLAANLDLEFHQRRDLLEESRVLSRVDQLQKHVANQLNIANLQEKLREGVQSEFSDAQRRAYLREQMRAIQKELGEDDGSDETLAELRDKVTAAGVPGEVMATLEREFSRIERLPQASPDYAGTLDYLETVAELPWSKLSDEQIDLDAAEQILDEDHHGLDRVKRRLLEYLAVRKLNPQGRGPILCLVGPPGVGKTSLGQSVARALGREFVRVALGGVRDEAEIRGHRRTYVGAMMGRILQELKRVGTRNPVMMLDEIDKMGGDFRGDPASALLEVLDPAQNNSFVDHYVNLPFDLSQVVFVTTANVLDTIPAPLRDRMEIVQLSGYTPNEKLAIAERYLVPRQLRENGMTDEQVQWAPGAIATVIERYTREAGVRLLEQKLGAAIRSAATKIARGRAETVEIDTDSITDSLGPPVVGQDPMSLEAKVGVVNGLAYTPVGGDVLPIEALRYAGTGQLRLTGQLGSVMQESAKAAESLVKSRTEALGIETPLSEYDTHLHVPAGAIPKDGPSAGVAMFLALASLHSNRLVRGDVAMTGEINLRGEVLPIGGLPEKTLAALANGIHRVLIPKGNEKDVETLPDEVKAAIELIPVATIEDVIEHAMV